MHGREDAGGRAGRTRGGMTGRGPGARRAHRARPLSARGQLVRPRPSSPHGNSSRAGIVGRRLPSHGGGPPERLPHRPMCVLPSPTRGGRCVGREGHRGPSAPEAPALPGPSWRPSPGPRRPGLQAPCTSAGEPRLRIPEPRPFQTRLEARRMRREQSEFSGKSRPRRQMPGFSRAAKPSAEGSGGHGHCPPGDKDASCPKRRLGRALALTVSRERPLCAVGTDEEPGF